MVASKRFGSTASRASEELRDVRDHTVGIEPGKVLGARSFHVLPR
jgi:hypothetical protein